MTMHKYFIVPLWVLLVTFSLDIFSQSFKNTPPIGPVKEQNEIMFGKDITIYDAPDQNQQNVTICSAFNSWFFAAYSYKKEDGIYLALLESSDNGYSWSLLADEIYTSTSNRVIKKISLTTSGNDILNLKLFLGVLTLDTILHLGSAWVARYNVDPFQGEISVFNPYHYFLDISLGNDFSQPASGSYPNSFALLCTPRGAKDTVILYSSSDGLVLNNRQVLSTSNDYYNKASFAFGSCNSYNAGQYFAVWEEMPDLITLHGHIYYSHSSPNFNSPFIPPVCLDSIDPSDIGKCRNPVIACQYGNFDNDSSNLTSVIIYEKFNNVTGEYILKGYYNLQSTNTRFFKPISFPDTLQKNCQASIAFNPYDSTFLITLYDSSNKKLPLLSNNLNLSNPNQWNLLSSGYNDNPVYSPYPTILVNPTESKSSMIWKGQGYNGFGVATFDASYSTYTATKKNNTLMEITEIIVFPNPCSDYTYLNFKVVNQTTIKFQILSLLGQPSLVLNSETISVGPYQKK